MAHDHGQSRVREGHARLLWIALGLTTAFMLAEVGAAFLTGSLALLSDAGHMFTDAAALGVSLIAIQIGKRAADTKRTFGYYRLEILAAAFNASLLLLVAVYILYEAYARLRSPEPINSMGMLTVAVLGLLVNLVSMRLLRTGSEDSLNVKGAYLEVWSDMLGSLGVIIAALLVRFTGALWVDPLVAAAIGVWVLPRTWVLLKEAINILLQGVPKGLDLEAIERTLKDIDGVMEIHDLHLWSLTSGKHVLSVHVVADLTRCTEQEILRAIRQAVAAFDIHHTTAQVEAQGFPCAGPDSSGAEEGHTHGH